MEGASPLGYADLLVNDLQEAVLSLRPEVGEALAALREVGAGATLVTGSGPTAVGLFEHIVAADRAAGALPPRYANAIVSASRGPRDRLCRDEPELGQSCASTRCCVVIALLAIAYCGVRRRAACRSTPRSSSTTSPTASGDWTYLVVSVLAFLETGAFVGLVFPGETAVIVAGAIAGQGETSIVITIALVWFSAWAGDSVSFWIGTKLGRDFILRHGHRVRITPERFAQVEDYFSRHGGKTILIGRFLGLVRALAPFIAGSSGMRYRAFLPYSVLGTGLWSATFSLLGYFLAENIHVAEDIAGRGIFVFGTVVVVVVGTIVAVRYMRVPGEPGEAGGAAGGEPVRRAGGGAGPQDRAAGPVPLEAGHAGEPGARVHQRDGGARGGAVHRRRLRRDASDNDPGPTRGDETAFEVADDLRSDWFTDVNKGVTKLGSAPVTLAVALVAAVWLGIGTALAGAGGVGRRVALVHLAVPILKEVARSAAAAGRAGGRGRGCWPSGHAAYAIIYPWLALTAATRLRSRLTYGTVLVVAAVLLAAAIGLSRVYLRRPLPERRELGRGAGRRERSPLCAAVALVVVHFRNNVPRE